MPRVSTALLFASLALTPLAARAQHTYSQPAATYDPRIPTPRVLLGYNIGDRFTPHRAMMRYIERIAAVSKRAKVDRVAGDIPVFVNSDRVLSVPKDLTAGEAVIRFAHDPVYRDLYRGLLPVFANAVLLGGTF